MYDPKPVEPDPRPQISLVSSGSAEPYRRLAEIFHDVLSEQSLGALLERIAAGRAKHAELLRAVQAFNRRLLSGFSTEEIDELRTLLAKLEQNTRTGAP